MEMSVHIDNQPFKVIYKQQGQKQWRGWTCRVRVCICPYQSIQLLDSVRIRPCLLHVRIADPIKNGGPYRCLIRRAWNA